MDSSKLIPIFMVIIIGIMGAYRISQVFSGSASQRTKMIRVICIVVGGIVAFILVGFKIFHVIP